MNITSASDKCKRGNDFFRFLPGTTGIDAAERYIIRMENKSYKRVLLLLSIYMPRLHRGIVDYARAHDWNLEVAYSGYLKESARSWKGDGVITDCAYYLEQLRKRGVRIASLIAPLAGKADCTVCPDDQKIGELAAEYFRHKGFLNFACTAATPRGNAFKERLQRYGHSVHMIPTRFPCSTESSLQRSLKRLRALPHPCALFCENDRDANLMLNLAQNIELLIPSEISILGVGNDDLLCNSKRISLSSVETRLYERGLRIAEELDRVLDGYPQQEILRIAPSKTVIERMSSGSYAVNHPVLCDMIQWLTARAATPVQISDLADAFHLSVSAVYRTFMNHLGISPKKLLLEARMDIAHRLLLDTDEKISSVSEEAGFPTSAAFFETFRRLHSCTPEAWRKGNR